MFSGLDVSSASKSEPNALDSPSMRFTPVDAAVLLSFCLFGVMTYLGRWKGITPFVFLSSDAGIVSSFVAAYEHPELFRGDALLGNFANFRYYVALHPLLIYALDKIVGDYGTAYVTLLNFTVVLQATGFYLLGRILFQGTHTQNASAAALHSAESNHYDRYWAFLLSVMSLCPVALPVREFWGIYDDPLPRSLFHATLPYLLAAAFLYRDQYRKWPWLMVGAGLAFYVHPVSGLPWGFAIWLGMWAFLPREWRPARKLGYMAVLGLVFVATLIPFAWNLSDTHQQAIGGDVKYRDVVGIIGDRVGKELLDVRTALVMWGEQLTSWPMAVFAAWALGASATVSLVSPEFRKGLRLLLIWMMGILFVSVAVTFVEQTVCRAYDLPRFQMDSIRGIKYIVPLMFILCLWPLAELCRILSIRRHTGTRSVSQSWAAALAPESAALLLGTALVVVWAFGHPPTFFMKTAKAWVSGRPMPAPTEKEYAAVEAVEAVAQITPPLSVILPVVLPLEVRYAALRPVAYAYKDGGIFADTNYAALPAWARVTRELEEIREQKDDPMGQLKRLLTLSLNLGADYVLTDRYVDPASAWVLGANVVWSNESTSLIQCRSGAGLPRP
jgi:hypothetical protein